MPAAARNSRRPAADSQPVLTCRELVRTFGLFERVMQPHFAGFGISGSQWGVLRHLAVAEHAGRPGLRGADLSERLLVRPPSVSGVVDRLVRAGLVERSGAPGDQRAKLVNLTDRGRRLVARIHDAHVGQMAAVTAALRPEEQTHLQRLLARLGRHLQHLLDETATRPADRLRPTEEPLP